MRPRRAIPFMSTVGPAGRAAAETMRIVPPESASTQWFLVAIIVGVAAGCLLSDAPGWQRIGAPALELLSALFLRTIESLIAALLFSMAVVGIVRHGADIRRIAGLVSRSIPYGELPKVLALAFGLVAVNAISPTLHATLAVEAPHGFLESTVRNEVVQLILCAIALGVALSHARGPLMLSCFERLSETMQRLVRVATRFAPIGVGAAVAATGARGGLGVLEHLGLLVLTLYGGLVAFVLVVLLPTAVIWNVPLLRFWRAIKEPWRVAFGTASSRAALPIALRNMQRFGVPRRIASIVLPAGYVFNMDGTVLSLALASVFVARAAGIDMTLSEQVLMLLTLMLASKGVAAVPRAALVIVAGTVAQLGVSLEGAAVILGVDALAGMARASLNLVGNCLAAALRAQWEGSLVPATEAVPLAGFRNGTREGVAPALPSRDAA